MKYLKKFELLESKKDLLSLNDIEENFIEFEDIGFKVVISEEELDCDFKIVGVLKDKRISINRLIREYDTMVSRLSNIGNVLFSKTYFNYITSNYNFEIKISYNFSDKKSINILLDNVKKVEFIPMSINYHDLGENGDIRFILSIIGRSILGTKKVLSLYYFNKEKGTGRNKSKKLITIDRKSTGVSISKEELSKLEIILMEDDDIIKTDIPISDFFDNFIN